MATNYPTLSFTSAEPVLLAYVKANQPVLLVGPPGVGKTALINAIGRQRGLPVESVIASTCDPTDFGGFPVVQPDGAFDRIPMRAIKRGSREPIALFFDEISTASGDSQAALLKGVHERIFGDVQLHPDTVIVAAMNPPEQAPGGHDLAAPLIGRFAVYDFRPTLDEVRDYFLDLGDDGSVLRSIATDWAFTTANEPGLIQLDPPANALAEGAKWASPRDWERGFRTAAALDSIDNEDLLSNVLAGCVGVEAADAFLGVRKLRIHLPTVDEVCADPANAKVPNNISYQLGAFGLLGNVCERDWYAAWIYADRLSPEVRAGVSRQLTKLAKYRSKAPKTHAKAGQKAMVKVLGSIGRKCDA